ncbi:MULTISPECIES: glycosyltransferase family 4 protein [Parabacteroides]|uniref:Glycosyl transferase family 1 domain-containing protein n=1 Tax=Parabacteroides goldsteinii dnLKV18 TaxID=1235789 RepID=S0GFJ2_9BACT|nr:MULTISPECIES: glycosyltransferase family 4 protein [Parabacteroides]EOS14421.1 hypothetical protein C803_04562 [Parabacteroides goldsteinii dnLKV18]KAI4362309.1 hypothetical protein C825_004392 [Parabacteroides sp. ASF519]MBF0767007.1 glycosyltransferase family 4 protein [Parabacteroides goldsteinii]MDZ3927100.1 glycosyltransferase family 4 protein [Parabacteroides goldsteinii]NBI94203.1 glycosyltransferase [Parabacteroides goldsteinii]
MKIVHLCMAGPYTQGYSYQENILPKYHVKLGFDVTVLTSMQTMDAATSTIKEIHAKQPVIFEENGFKVVRIPFKEKVPKVISRRFRMYANFFTYLEIEKPDIIFTHGTCFVDSRQLVKYLKLHPKVICYSDCHTDYYNSARNFLSKYILHGIVWRYFSHLSEPYIKMCFGTTPWRCDFMHEMYGFPLQKLKCIPMGVDDDNIPSYENARSYVKSKFNIKDSDFLIVTGGKIDEAKNIHHLGYTIRKMENPNVKLLIFGSIVSTMEDSFEPLRCCPNIIFAGWSDATQVMNYLRASNLCCFPGTHSTMWEQAVGVGIPAIYNDWGKSMHHLNINGNCIFIDGKNETAIADTIRGLIFSDKYQNLKQKAEKASIHFKYSEIAKQSIEMNF